MPISFRRFSAALLAGAMAASLAIETSMAQTAPVGPAGGTGTTTAPSNSEGTPSGGTGVLGATRVGPSNVAPTPGPTASMPTPDAPPRARRRRVRHGRRYHPRPAADTQSFNIAPVAPVSLG